MSTQTDLKTLRFEPLSAGRIQEVMGIEQVSNSVPWSEKSFKAELENPESLFFLSILQSKVVGYVGVWLCIDEAHITTVAVAPELRRNGIGKRLVQHALGEAVKRGAKCSTLEVRASNESAIQLYEKLGFSSVARRKSYYPDNREDAVVMWRYDLAD